MEQVPYHCKTQQKGWTPLPSIDFRVQGRDGMNLTDALNVRFDGPDGRDDLMFTHDSIGNSVSCRMEVRGFCDRTFIVTQSFTRLVQGIPRVRPKAGAANFFLCVRLVE